MAKKRKIIEGHTLDQYDKRYGKSGLRKVQKKYADKDETLLEGSNWWLIDDTYYELPKNPVGYWWKNLSKAGKIALCVLGVGAVTAGVLTPVLIGINSKITDKTADKDGTGKELVTSATFKKESDGSYKGTITYKDVASKAQVASIKVKVGNTELSQDKYTVDIEKGTITINAGVVNDGDTITIIVTKKDTPEPTPEVIHVTGVTLNETKSELTEGETLQLKATVAPENATNKNVTWESSDKDIAEVDNNGKVTALKKGEVVITVKSEDDQSKFATRKLTVIEKEEPVKVTTKAQWVAAADKLADEFDKATTVYDKEDISDVQIRDHTGEITNISYDDSGDRDFSIKLSDSNLTTFAGKQDVSGQYFKDQISSETEDGHYTINTDGSIEYYTDTIPEGKDWWYKSIKINQYGYLCYLSIVSNYEGQISEVILKATYNGAPHETKQETDKEKFVRLYNKYNNVYKESELVYDTSNISSVHFVNEAYPEGKTETVTNIEYSSVDNIRETTLLSENYSAAIDTTNRIGVLDYLKDSTEEGVTYDFDQKGYIVYNNTNSPSEEDIIFIQTLKVNEYGYVTEFIGFFNDILLSYRFTIEGEPREETDREKFIRLYREYNSEYNESSAVYSKDQVSFYVAQKNGNISYLNVTSISTSDDSNRTTTLTDENGGTQRIDTNYTDFTEALSKIKESGSYGFLDDGSIEYIDNSATTNEIYQFKVNKFGYVTLFYTAGTGEDEINGYYLLFNSEPKESKSK